MTSDKWALEVNKKLSEEEQLHTKNLKGKPSVP